MKKLIRITTSDISLDLLLKGQLKFLNQYYEVIGVSSDTGLLQQVARREGIRVAELSMKRNISLRRDLACLIHLIRLFHKEKPFIVHANTPKASLLSMTAAWIDRVPHRIYTVTGLRYQGMSGLGRAILKTTERITCLMANKVIPEGQGVKQTLRTDCITNKPLEVIHHGNINGIDTSHFNADVCRATRQQMRKTLHIDDNDFAFIFIGRIVKDKGMDELAMAMKNISASNHHCKLILVGWFEKEHDSIKEFSEDFFKYSNCVRYVGYRKDVRPYLLAADALVFPSYREGFPQVVMEAGAMGLPSIVTDINGCNEIIVEGKNGHIIPPKDAKALYSMMLHFIENPLEVARLAGNARAMIQQRYEHSDVMAELLKMYQQLE